MNTPNWQKNSGKVKKGKGICKGKNSKGQETGFGMY